MNGVLVDTSVWVDHFRVGNPALIELLGADRVMTHPLVVAEIACGTPPHRARTLSDVASLQQVQQASVGEVMDLIERERLFGSGVGVVDLLLLASTLMTQEVELWTRDRRLSALARRFGVMHAPLPR